MRHVIYLLFGFSFLIPVSGCGEPTYDIPEVNQEDSKRESERIKQEIEAEMKKRAGGGRPSKG